VWATLICASYSLCSVAAHCSFSGDKERFTTRGDPVSFTGANFTTARRWTFRRRKIRRGDLFRRAIIFCDTCKALSSVRPHGRKTAET